MSQGPVMLNIEEGVRQGLIIIDPYQSIYEQATRHINFGMTSNGLDSIRSDEEQMKDNLTIKSTTRLRPGFFSYNNCERQVKDAIT